MKRLIVLLCILMGSTVYGVDRFDQDQLQFSLLDSDGQVISCEHEPLTNQSPAPPPPWWKVTCEKRKYVVDVWMDRVKKQNSIAIDFMFHAKESTSSSGEKRTRFDSHLTRMEFEQNLLPTRFTSNIDVRNGLADLRVQVQLK